MMMIFVLLLWAYMADKHALAQNAGGCGEKYMMTEEQANVLEKAGFPIYGEVEALSSVQRRILTNYQTCVNYLAQKYPDDVFRLAYVHPQNVLQAYEAFLFFAEGFDKRPTEVRVFSSNETSCVTDDFYGLRYGSDFEELLQGILSTKYAQARLVGDIFGQTDQKQDEKMPIATALRDKVPLIPGARIYLPFDFCTVEGLPGVALGMQTLLERNNIYGMYTVYLLTCTATEALKDILLLDQKISYASDPYLYWAAKESFAIQSEKR